MTPFNDDIHITIPTNMGEALRKYRSRNPQNVENKLLENEHRNLKPTNTESIDGINVDFSLTDDESSAGGDSGSSGIGSLSLRPRATSKGPRL